MKILNCSPSIPADLFQYEHRLLKAACHLNCTGQPCVECGINGKVMQRLEKEVRAERERRILLPGVTGEVIHEERTATGGGETRRRNGGSEKR